MKAIISSLLTSTLYGGELSASHPGHLTPEKRSPIPIGYKAFWDTVGLARPLKVMEIPEAQEKKFLRPLKGV
jgi:hypothetical protein